MKKLLFLLLFIPLIFSCSSGDGDNENEENEETFLYLDSNGVTVKAKDNATLGQTYILNGIAYKLVSGTELKEMISNGTDVSKVCTSRINDMSSLFYENQTFNDNISSWDTSNVTNMSKLFYGAENFNQNISNWDVSKVTKFDAMFRNAKSFNQNISSWKLLSAVFVRDMFRNAYEFNQDLSNWNLNNLNTNNLGGCCGFRSAYGPMKWTKAIPNFGTLIGGSTYYCGDIYYNGCQY